MSHSRRKLARDRKLTKGHTESAEVEAMRAEIRLAFDLGQSVYDRRTALGLSPAELAERADLTQPEVSLIEGGGSSLPMLPLLARLAQALDASLNIALDGDESRIALTPHESRVRQSPR